jgi:hypothetical protein
MSKLTPRQLDALDRIEKKPELQPFFFKKLKGLHWFDELETREFFNPKHNPKPVPSDQEGFFSIPNWCILEYLEKTSFELQKPENLDYAVKFLQIIRNVTEKAIEDGVDNYRTWWYFAKIVKVIPIEKIMIDDVKLFKYWLNDRFDTVLVGIELGEHFLPHLLACDSIHAQDLAVGIINALTSLTWHNRSWGNSEELECILPVKAYHSNKIFNAQARTIGMKLEGVGVSIFRDRLNEIFGKTTKDNYSTIWRPALEEHEQNKSKGNVENVLVSAFRDSLLGYIDRRATAASDYVGELLDSDTVLFKRVAIYVVDVYNKELYGLVNKILDPQYFAFHYQHEMYHLLQNCYSRFDGAGKETVLSIIQNIADKRKGPEEFRDMQKKQEAVTLLRWLSAIRGQGSQKVDDLYAKNFAITKAEPKHPDFSSYMEEGCVGELSPYSVQELLSRDFDDLSKILRSFKEGNGWKTPSRQGLAQTLKEALKSKPELFKGHLMELVDIDFDYTYHLIDGYKDLWKEEQYDNWQELLEFCWNLIQQENFWVNDTSKQRGESAVSFDGIVGVISEIIRAGTVDDKKAFDPSLLPTARQIIVYILENLEEDSFAAEHNAVINAMNSPRGKCLEALINYALRLCRLEDKSKNTHDELWIENLQTLFDGQIDKVRDRNFEFVTLFAKHLPNLIYMSRSWTIHQLPIIFQKGFHFRWLCAMEGYSYVNIIYPEIYRFLSENNHFRDALDAQELDARGKESIIQNIVIAYLRGDERLEDKTGMLCWLIDRWKLQELRQLTLFVWTLRSDPQKDISAKVMPLWIELSAHADPSKEVDKSILSRLCMWSVFVDELTAQTTDFLLQVAPYADLEHDAYILIQELKRLVGRFPDQVADIFIRMLNSFAPTFERMDIEYIISKLYEIGGEHRRKANSICDKYIKYGIEFPAEIRARYLR